MLDLFENHIVGFLMTQLMISCIVVECLISVIFFHNIDGRTDISF